MNRFTTLRSWRRRRKGYNEPLGRTRRRPEPSIGSLLNDAKSHLREAWWMAVFPGATLAFLLLCLNFLADAINEATSPYSQRKL